MSEHAFSSVICRYDTRYDHRPSDRDVNWVSPVQRKSPLCRLKNPTVISIWLLVGFHPATRSVQSTPADNTRKRVWQYIEKERKKNQNGHKVTYNKT